MGPLVQGPNLGRADKIRIVATFALAFVAGAIAIFALISAVGTAFGIAELPVHGRIGVGAAGLMALAAVDIAAIRASRYCPLGWRRQTPKILVRRFSPTMVAGAWGFDTGLAVTTFRVAAATWGAFLLVGLGFGPWWTGAVYGVAFAIPHVVLLCCHRSGRTAWESGPADPGLESMLKRRPVAQTASAALLLAGGAILISALLE